VLGMACVDGVNGIWISRLVQKADAVVAFCAFALMIGARHGLDADHLATIDSLTRCNGIDRPRLARLTGLCFSLGHGVVVLFVAIAAAVATSRWRTPEWLDVAGSF